MRVRDDVERREHHVERCCHVVLSVDQLVPLSVVGKLHEVVVGELQAGLVESASSLPGIRRILRTEGPT
jgi:hypothetical protein